MSAKLKSTLLIVSALLLSSNISAAPKLDVNGDDEISQIEYMSFQSNIFNKDDKNFDGKLTSQERSAATQVRIQESAKKRFKGMDINRDGKITADEYDMQAQDKEETTAEKNEAKADKWFEMLDSDNNGHISRLEYDKYRGVRDTSRREKRITTAQKQFAKMDLDGDGVIMEDEYVFKGRDPNSPNDKTGLSDIYGANTPTKTKRVRRDGNGDGDITKTEDREYNLYRFSKLDKNGDGVITKKENSWIFKSSEANYFMHRSDIFIPN